MTTKNKWFARAVHFLSRVLFFLLPFSASVLVALRLVGKLLFLWHCDKDKGLWNVADSCLLGFLVHPSMGHYGRVTDMGCPGLSQASKQLQGRPRSTNFNLLPLLPVPHQAFVQYDYMFKAIENEICFFTHSRAWPDMRDIYIYITFEFRRSLRSCSWHKTCFGKKMRTNPWNVLF